METQTNYKRLALALCLAAGILYNSWPLGYLLDSRTAHTALASNLERAGHPYAWLFVLGDVLTGLCLIAAAIILYTKTWLSAGLLIFGLFTAISAIFTYSGAGHVTGLGLDALTSTIAAIGLFISLISLVKNRVNVAVLAFWLASVISFVGYALLRPNQAYLPQDILLVISGLALFVIGLNLRQLW